jgi:hypothetical protein
MNIWTKIMLRADKRRSKALLKKDKDKSKRKKK